MDYAVINVPAAPVRRKPMHRKEMINQLLFGETVKLLKTKGDHWVKIRSLHDGYEGWMTNTMFAIVSEEIAQSKRLYVTADLLSTLDINDKKINIPAGASLPFFANGKGLLGMFPYTFHGKRYNREEQKPDAALINQLVMPWLNAPYMWGGRTALGIDCSGFVQVIFKMMGIDLCRDAWQQAQEGKPVKKFRDVKTGDLVFFNNKEEIVHVGIMLGNNKLIHASGKVRIDEIDKKGIINTDTGKRTLQLRAIRRLF